MKIKIYIKWLQVVVESHNNKKMKIKANKGVQVMK